MNDWIPCHERLPDHEGNYLVTFQLLSIYPVEVCYFDGSVWDKGQYDEVLAWMSLPESYGAQAMDKECTGCTWVWKTTLGICPNCGAKLRPIRPI